MGIVPPESNMRAYASCKAAYLAPYLVDNSSKHNSHWLLSNRVDGAADLAQAGSCEGIPLKAAEGGRQRHP